MPETRRVDRASLHPKTPAWVVFRDGMPFIRYEEEVGYSYEPVNPDAWRTAIRIAQRNMRRILIIDENTIEVKNDYR